MRAELDLLFEALGIPYIDVHRIKICIKSAIKEKGLLLVTDSELGLMSPLWVIGFWFGRILDNNAVFVEDYWAD